MPFGIYGGVLDWPGSQYDQQPVQTTLIKLNRDIENPATRDQGIADLKAMEALPQFQGFGWQGLLGMLGAISGGTALAGALGGAGGLGGTLGGATVPGTAGTGSGSLGTLGSILSSPLLQGGLGFLGGLLNNTQGARTQVQAPVIAPEFQGIAGLLRQRAMERLSQPIDMASLGAQGIEGINDTFRGIQQANNNNLTARGLARSPVAAVVDATANNARGAQIASFLNQLPLLQQQLSNSNLAAGGDVLRFGTGSQTQLPGSALGGGLSNLAGTLGTIYYNNRYRNGVNG